MNKSLSQREIDILFRGTEGGVTPDPKAGTTAAEVVPYSFTRPRRISKERRAACEAIYGRFAAAFESWLSLRLGAAEVKLVGVDQVAFCELILSLGSPSASFVFRSGAWRGVCDLSIDLALSYVDRVLGGPAEASTAKRPLSEIEGRIARGCADRVCQLLREAWQDDIAIEPEIAGLESDPEMLEIVPREENVLAALCEVRFGQASGYLTLGMPMEAVESFLLDRKMVRQPRDAKAPAPGAGTPPLAAIPGLSHANLSLSARFPTIFLSTRALGELREGQVIHTGHPVDAPVEVLVNGRVRFLGSLGQRQRRMALRILQPITVPVSERPEHVNEGRVL